MRVRGLSLETRQAFRTAAATWHDPDVIRVRETDLSRTHGWSSEQTSLTSVSVLSADWNGNHDGTESEQKYARKHGACPPDWKCECDCELTEDYHIILAKPISEEKDHEFP